jgi:hypothetical protein
MMPTNYSAMLGNLGFSGKTGYAPMQPNQMQTGYANDPARTIQPIPGMHQGSITNHVAPPSGMQYGNNGEFIPIGTVSGGGAKAVQNPYGNNQSQTGSTYGAGMQTTQPFQGQYGGQAMPQQMSPYGGQVNPQMLQQMFANMRHPVNAARPQSLIANPMVK